MQSCGLGILYRVIFAIYLTPVVETDLEVKVASNWKELGRDLGLDEDTLESIVGQYSDNPMKCLFQVCLAWQRMKGLLLEAGRDNQPNSVQVPIMLTSF